MTKEQLHAEIVSRLCDIGTLLGSPDDYEMTLIVRSKHSPTRSILETTEPGDLEIAFATARYLRDDPKTEVFRPIGK